MPFTKLSSKIISCERPDNGNLPSSGVDIDFALCLKNRCRSSLHHVFSISDYQCKQSEVRCSGAPNTTSILSNCCIKEYETGAMSHDMVRGRQTAYILAHMCGELMPYPWHCSSYVVRRMSSVSPISTM